MKDVLETLRQELRTHLGADALDLPDTAANRLLNNSYWELLDKFPFREKEATASFGTLDGLPYITIPEDLEAIRKVSIMDGNSGSFKVLDRMTVDYFENTRLDNFVASDSRGTPERYYREKDRIYLNPIPDGSYSIVLHYWELLDDMVASQDQSGLPRNWDEIILQGAVYRGYLRLQDQVRANNARELWKGLVTSVSPTESEEEVDSNRAGLQIRYQGYDW